MKSCIDCSKPITKKATRCKTCSMTEANLVRWKQESDPRRKKLQERNKSVRNGNTPYTDKEWLSIRYEVQKMSLREIAKEADCSLRTIARWIEIHSISTRDNKISRQLSTKVGSDNPRWKGGRNKICDCGNTMVKSSKRCTDCYTAEMKTKRGKLSHTYKGIADIMVLVRGWTHHHWRPLIFERDEYSCQNCGDKRGHNLNAHHIHLLSAIVGEKYNLWKPNLNSPEGRSEFVTRLISDLEIINLENGITLCKPCHKEAHKKIKYMHLLPKKKLIAI